MALRALSTAMDDSHLQSAIEKFQPMEKESGAEPLSVDLSVLNERARVQRNLRALRRAIREKERGAHHLCQRCGARGDARGGTAAARLPMVRLVSDRVVAQARQARDLQAHPHGRRGADRGTLPGAPARRAAGGQPQRGGGDLRCKPAARVPAIEYLHAEPAGTLENGDLLFRASLPQEEFFWRARCWRWGRRSR